MIIDKRYCPRCKIEVATVKGENRSKMKLFENNNLHFPLDNYMCKKCAIKRRVKNVH